MPVSATHQLSFIDENFNFHRINFYWRKRVLVLSLISYAALTKNAICFHVLALIDGLEEVGFNDILHATLSVATLNCVLEIHFVRCHIVAEFLKINID